MSDVYLRQWEMLRMIPPLPRKASAAALTEGLNDKGFGVGLRTVQRDLNTLSRTLPLLSDGAKPAGWSWSEKKVFDVPGMDAPTALTFVLVERFLARLMPRQSLVYLKAHFARAREVLKGVDNRSLRDWTTKARALPSGLQLIPAETNPKVLDAVYTALLGEKRLAVRYTPRGASVTKAYEISPLGIVVRNAVTYLVATLWNYDSPTHIPAHRIASATVLEKACTAPDGFDLDKYIASGRFSYPVSKDKLKLEVLFEKEPATHLHETWLSQDQELTETPDGRVLLTATVLDSNELRWWLLGFGDKVEVLGPKRLRGEFNAIAGNLARRYQAS